jgi:hypothetical protein
MKQTLTLTFLCLAMIGSIQAQTAPVAPAPVTPPSLTSNAWNVSINGGYSSVENAATNNGFLTTEALKIANSWDLRADTFITQGPDATIVLAGPEYRFALSKFFKPNPAIALNTSNLEAFVNVGLGDARTSATAANGTTTLSKASFAWKLGVGFDILVSKTMSFRPLDISYVRASMLQNGGQVLGNHLQLGATLGLRF